ncbi:MAG: hypothetical protein NTZ74_02520 [Chloroflexi bacterium]|nr:hypothetical protein [Chloroflexota bacterium]
MKKIHLYSLTKNKSHKILIEFKIDCPFVKEYSVYWIVTGTSQYRNMRRAMIERLSEA